MHAWSVVRSIVPQTRSARLVLAVVLVLMITGIIFRDDVGKFLGIVPAQAASYQMQTGYFMGNGGSKEISGLGFSPELVIIKANDASGAGAIMKTTAMPGLNTAYLGSATADAATGLIELTSDGFRVTGANTNTANARFTWIAFAGSDCSSSGQFCVGAYTGNGTSPRAITTGFSPDLAIVKAATGVAPNWRSLSMPDNYGQYFMATAQDTTGALFTTLDATGFTVGATNNTNAVTYYYVAFEEVGGVIDVGTYTGNATNNRNISGVGFVPDFMFTKYATGTIGAVYNVTESYGDSTSYFTDTASLVASVLALQSDGFQLGTSNTANGAGVMYYYAAFGGANDTRNTSGSFTSVSGSYVGTGGPQAIGNLGFSPDLVIIKASTTQAGVFRTRMMAGDSTAYLDSATANFTGGITALNPTGFTVGTAAQVNTSGVMYYWTAYGNAWNPDTNTGASDFTVGAYYGNGIGNRNVTRLPFAPDLVTIKRSGATGGTWRTSEHVGDLSSFFAATAETANNIQALNADGFAVGTTANVNTAANIYWYFAFATGTDFTVGTYTGTGVAHTENTSFQPDHLWVKSTTTTRGVLSTTELSLQGSTSAPFINVAPITNAVTGLTPAGFSVGTGAETNTNGTRYRYAAWQNDTTMSTSTYAMQTGYFMGNGGSKEISGLGFSPEVVIIKANDASGVGAVMKTISMPQNNSVFLGSASTDDATGLVTLTADGFRVAGANANTANARFTWTAFAGSDCSTSGTMCTGSYVGNGTSPRAITTGFSPDLVMMKMATTTASPNWRSLSMPDNYGQYFTATAQNTAGALFTTLDATGFTVGATNNANLVTYYYVSFQESAGAIDVGTYAGNGLDDRSITGVGFQPELFFTKQTGAVGAVYNTTESYGDSASYFTDTANLVNAVQRLETDGFMLGTSNTANAAATTYYYSAFGSSTAPASTGTFQIQSGSYTGSGGAQAIQGIGFVPDLVIIKGDTAQAGVFRTRMMAGDSTAYLDSAVANFTGGITALQPNGFTVGTNAAVNTAGLTYYWTAYGNAWNPDTNTGASDFTIGAYYGNGLDSRNITNLPFSPDMVSIKRNGATGGSWRTSSHSGDSSSFFSATADGANRVQALNADGFQIGTNVEVNTAANIYWYFGFATSSTFSVGTYSGTGASQNITLGFEPELLWVKRTAATQGVQRPRELSGDAALPFINTTTVTGAITDLTQTGFTVGTAVETNTAGANNYRYVAWKKNVLNQIHYHWRADDGSEVSASSLTGGVEDTALSQVREGLTYRLRVAVSNEGGVTASSTGFRLEYGEKSGTCTAVTTWTRVGDADGAWDMYDSSNLTDGAHTTNVDVADGGVTDENNIFLTPNGGVKDTNDETAILTIAGDEFVEFEYALQATAYATDTTAYCFRVTGQGTPLSDYLVYPEATFALHMQGTTTGSQVNEISIPATDTHVGGAFVFYDNTLADTHSITDVTLTESGTVDAVSGLDNIKLYYEYDTSNPYDCASESYSGSETQYGTTDSDGFSSANGTTTFAGSVVASSTQAVCFYTVLDVTSSALSGETIKINIDTASDIVLSSGDTVRFVQTPLSVTGTTTLAASLVTQVHYQWRLDDGNEAGASSATAGTEDTVLVNLAKSTPRRIRFGVSNEGLATSSVISYRVEYAQRSGSCIATVSGWTDVGAVGGAWDMYNSTNLTDGTNTTNIAVGTGGVTDENTTFLATNGGVRDTSSQTGGLTLSPTEFVDFEYSLVATTNALDGESYCFRVTDAGTPLLAYDAYPEVSIAADMLMTTLGSHIPAVRASSTNNYMGGAWAITDLSGSHTITAITLSELGTVDADANISNVRLYYELDTSNPYTCASESYSGSETQYGTTDSDGFSSANGTSTFTGSVNISTTASMCIYAVLDVEDGAGDGETIELTIANPGVDIVPNTGTINPNNPIGPAGSTTVQKAQLRQEHFHFRNDDGTEAGATSATGGVEDVSIGDVMAGYVQRLRVEVSNEGSTTTEPTTYTLQYAERVTTCSSASGWQAVGTSGAHWSVSGSDNLTAGNSTTNVGTTTGGVTDENSVFLTPNEGVIEGSATTSSLELDIDEFVEFEFVLEANTDATPGTTYCFRLVGNDADLTTYATYAEATIKTSGDFYIQRGISDIANLSSSISITAGVEYTAPRASTSAFIRITNAAHTGAGPISGGGTQNANSVTVSIVNPSDIETGITFRRAGTANVTRIYWEIIEYIGPVGGDNEIIVREQGAQAYTTTETSTSTATVPDIGDDADVVVFITGQRNSAANSTNYHAGLSTSAWDSGNDRATFTRGVTGTVVATTSYAVVEFTGVNWKIQRAEHTYSVAGATEIENITPVNDTSRAFLHTQKLVGVNQVDEFGHQVWLSSVGQVSFSVPATSASIGTHTSVAWVIENTQTTGQPMVVTRSANSQAAGGVEPSTYSIGIGTTISSVNNASLFMNMWSLGDNTFHPRGIMGAGITSTTNYELWISDTGSGRSYRTEIVDWPTAELTFEQTYYRWYVNNDALDPIDAWPPGVSDVGESTTITSLDGPPGNGDVLRLRMDIAIHGSNLSQGTKRFKLQYGVRASTTCDAIETWNDVGETASTTAVWRGYNATPLDGTALSTNPPTGGDLNVSVSDRAGTYEEINPSAYNPYKIIIGDDVEYDWILEANDVSDQTFYCFRMTHEDNTPLDEYTNYPYPTLRTSGFLVEQSTWQWYDDETSLTPSVALSATNTAPSSVDQNNTIKLRVALEEVAGKAGQNVKFKLQWSEFSDFSTVYDVHDMDSCTAGSRWCYNEGAGTNNATITSSVLPDVDSCIAGVGDGCGTHNEYPYTPKYIGEVGTTTTDYTGTLVTLQRTYSDPVFIVEAITGDATGGSSNRPAVAIITATSTSSFTVRIQEPVNEPDTHGTEEVAYIVMERGAFVLPDGTMVDVNATTTSEYYGNAVAGSGDGTCTFTQTFSQTPIVLTALQSDNNTGTPDFLTASQQLVTPTNFACSIEVPDDETIAPSQPETYAWIAFSQGAFTNNGIPLEATTTSASITGWTDTPWYEHAFFADFLNTPGIVASKQTRVGTDGGWVRYDGVDIDSVQFAMDEKSTPERAHPAETIGYFAFAGEGLLHDDSGISEFMFEAHTRKEFEFTLRHADARPNTTYFFRLYEVTGNTVVEPSISDTSPSLATQSATLTFSISGLTNGTTTEGVTLDVTTTATSVPFGTLSFDTPKNAGQRMTVTTNATEGYQVLMYERQDLIAGGGIISDITGTNLAPVAWNTGCLISVSGCYGYHVGDNTLSGGSTRFLVTDTFASASTSPAEVAHSSGPVNAESTDVVYRVEIRSGQPAGHYESKIVYIVIPVF